MTKGELIDLTLKQRLTTIKDCDEFLRSYGFHFHVNIEGKTYYVSVTDEMIIERVFINPFYKFVFKSHFIY